MSELDERYMQSWRDRDLARSKDIVAERAAKSDGLLNVGSFSVLSEPDRQTVEAAGRWLTYLWQQGFSMEVNAIEHDGIHDTIVRLRELSRKAP